MQSIAEETKPGYSNAVTPAAQRPATSAAPKLMRPRCRASKRIMNAPNAAAADSVWLTNIIPYA